MLRRSGAPGRATSSAGGDPLVLVHGLSGAAVNFAELAPLLAART